MVARFANKRNALSQTNQELIVLHDPHSDEENIFDALKEADLNVYLGQSDKLRNQLEIASCLKRLTCHHKDSNICRNIVAANAKQHCASTCASTPKTPDPLTTEDLNRLLEMGDHNRRMDSRWSWDIVKYEAR